MRGKATICTLGSNFIKKRISQNDSSGYFWIMGLEVTFLLLLSKFPKLPVLSMYYSLKEVTLYTLQVWGIPLHAIYSAVGHHVRLQYVYEH